MIFDITSHAKGFARQHGSTVIGLYGTASSAIAVFEGSKDPIDYMDLTAGLAGTGTGLIRVSIGYSVPYAGEILLCYSALRIAHDIINEPTPLRTGPKFPKFNEVSPMYYYDY